MQWGAKTYAIFWVPAHLQNGGATSMSSHYQTVLKNLLLDYGKHGVDNNNTQYYQSSGTGKSYIQNYGYLAVSYVTLTRIPRRDARTLRRRATASPTRKSRPKSRG